MLCVHVNTHICIHTHVSKFECTTELAVIKNKWTFIRFESPD